MATHQRSIPHRLANVLVWLLILVPAPWLLFRATTGGLGPDPGKAMLLSCGLWGMRFLLLTLSMSSLRRLTGWPHWIGWRRRFGLATWVYASLHLSLAVIFVIGWSWPEIQKAVIERPYILLGLAAWLALWPLALTSTQAARRRLGKRWYRLHRLIYPIAILICLHVWLQLRADWGEWLVYTLWLSGLFGERIWQRLHRQRLARV